MSDPDRRWIPRSIATLSAAGLCAALGFEAGRRWPFERLEILIGRRPPLDATIVAPPWEALPPADSARFETLSTRVGDRLLIMGGFTNTKFVVTSSVMALDLGTRRWSRLAELPSAPTHGNAVAIGDTVWVVGGFEGDHPGRASPVVWRYAVTTDRWTAGPPLPAPRGGGSLAARGDTLHYVGGWLADRTTDASDHWVLAPGDTSWRAGPPLPRPRGHAGAATVGDAFYVVGGVVGHDPSPLDVAHVDRYDLVRRAWTPVRSLPLPLSHLEAGTQSYDGRLLVVGGRSKPTGVEETTGVLSYNPATDRWTHLWRLPIPLAGAVSFVRGDSLGVGLGSIERQRAFNAAFWHAPMRDRWWTGTPMPSPLGEVAMGVIGDRLYVVGQGDSRTHVYDLAGGTWLSATTAGARPAPGNHHAAEVVNDRLWLLGGFDDGAPGVVQVYDPATNTWAFGPPMPFAAGSSASAVIGGRIYVAGGIVGDTTTGAAAVLDPATRVWKSIAPMPRPRNHAAAATDGRRLFVFGGRGPGSGASNMVANGFGDVQIYDPVTNRWRVSDGSPGAPRALPEPRGGTGRAVWLNDEFWIIGGETTDSPRANAQHTYDRVDIYNPVANAWRPGPPLGTARHGIYPVAHEGLVIVVGGGPHAGAGRSALMELIWPRRRLSPP